MGILTKKKKARGEGGERKEKLAGYCVSLQDPETKAPPPQGKIWRVWGRRGEESRGLEDGSQVQSKGVTYFRGVSWPPVLHYNLFISFSFLSPEP